MLGVPAKLDEILKISKKFKVPVIEDNCESVGAKYKNKYLCNFGKIGVISFDHGKLLTCGEGGMVFTNDDKLDQYCREYHDHGHENNPKFARGMDTRKIYGFNYRMTELQAVVGKVQLSKIDYIPQDVYIFDDTITNNIA